MLRYLEKALDPSTRSHNTLLIKYEHMIVVISKFRDIVPAFDRHVIAIRTKRSELAFPFERVSLPRSGDHDDLLCGCLRKGP